MIQVVQENDKYLTDQLITCIGNKRNLLPFIGKALSLVREREGKSALSFFDVFSGSGIVSRYFRQFASCIVANDLEPYATTISRCYLSPSSLMRSPEFVAVWQSIRNKLDHEPLLTGPLSRHYAPQDDTHIGQGERVFYTSRNARYLDTARALIAQAPLQWQDLLLAPLLSEASIHANTAGVFKGFYKNAETGVGTFGGKKGDALSRIMGNIHLELPVTSAFDCPAIVLSGDANEVSRIAPEVDIAYLDPPYNQHPYGSNYFMLNLLVDGNEPEKPSAISGIPAHWNRSRYNKRIEAALALEDLVSSLKASYLLISFNSEGFISRGIMETLLQKFGEVHIMETPYSVFRGSRNLAGREKQVTEYLYLVKKNA